MIHQVSLKAAKTDDIQWRYMLTHMLRQMLSEVIQMPRCAARNRNMPSSPQTKQKLLIIDVNHSWTVFHQTLLFDLLFSGEDQAPVLRCGIYKKSGKQTDLKTGRRVVVVDVDIHPAILGSNPISHKAA